VCRAVRVTSENPARGRLNGDAIVSVSVAGAATVAAPWVSAVFEAKRQAERLAHERRVRDVDELRAHLDESADLLDHLSHSAADLTGSALVASVGAALEAGPPPHVERTRVANRRRVGRDGGHRSPGGLEADYGGGVEGAPGRRR
jgi:hypothetical protein